MPPKLAETLKRLRLAHGVSSQVKLADAIGVSPGTIGNAEAGTRNLSHELCEAVVVALGLDAEEAAELLSAAGHGDRPSLATTFSERLDAVESNQERQELALREVRDLLQALLPKPSPRRRARQ